MQLTALQKQCLTLTSPVMMVDATANATADCASKSLLAFLDKRIEDEEWWSQTDRTDDLLLAKQALSQLS